MNLRLLPLAVLTLAMVMAPLADMSKEVVLELSGPDSEATNQAPWVSVEDDINGLSMENVVSISPDGNWAITHYPPGASYVDTHLAPALINLTNGGSSVYLPLQSFGPGWCGIVWAPDSSRFYRWNNAGDMYVYHISTNSSNEEFLAVHTGTTNCYGVSNAAYGNPNFVTEDYTIVFENGLYNDNGPIYSCIFVLLPTSENVLSPERIHCRTDYLELEFELIGFSSNTGKIIGIYGDTDLVLINDKVYNSSTSPEVIEEIESVWMPAEGHFRVGPNGLIGIDIDQDGRADYWDYDEDGVVSFSDQCPSTPTADVADDLGCSWGQYDNDGDGYLNILDEFPEDACAYLDSDDDGKPDDVVSGCSTTLMMDVDDDNDGYDDREDDCPTQGTYDLPDWIDTDADGICNNQDSDDDDDGYSDWDELIACGEVSDHLDPDITPTDTDSDGRCDELDLDDDGDGWSDEREKSCDKHPLDPSSTPVDTDSDGTCNFLDEDDDNDGYHDNEDDFPLNPDRAWNLWTTSRYCCCGLGILILALLLAD